MLKLRLALVGVLLCACSPADPGPMGDQGEQGPEGMRGMTGMMGDPGPSGTAGQDVIEVYGTGQLTVSTGTTAFTTIPGLSTVVDVPEDTKVVISTNGGVQCTGVGTSFSAVDIAIFVDGVASNQGGQRRVIAANTTAVGQIIANWSMMRTYPLTPGNHTIEVRAINAEPTATAANVSSASAPQLQAVLTVMLIRQ